jgi:hypothetical protein
MAFPDIAPNRTEISQQTPMIVLQALNGREERLATRIPFFTIINTYENLTAAERRQIIGHHASVGGSLTAFSIELPEDVKDSSAGYTGAITVDGAHTAGDTTVDITTASDGAILKAGDYIKFAGHNKLYQVTADVTAASSSATVSIFPALLDSLSNAEVVSHTDVNIVVRYASDDIMYAMDPNLFGTLSISFKEDI